MTETNAAMEAYIFLPRDNREQDYEIVRGDPKNGTSLYCVPYRIVAEAAVKELNALHARLLAAEASERTWRKLAHDQGVRAGAAEKLIQEFNAQLKEEARLCGLPPEIRAKLSIELFMTKAKERIAALTNKEPQ